jgi:hypothetical protein
MSLTLNDVRRIITAVATQASMTKDLARQLANGEVYGDESFQQRDRMLASFEQTIYEDACLLEKLHQMERELTK